MRWLELTVEADAEAVEAVSEVLGRVAAGTAVRPTRLIRDPGDELVAREDPDAPYEVTAHIADDAAAPGAVEATERALWHLQAFGLRPVGELRVRRVDDADWLERWKDGYAPQRIGRVVVVPSWLEVELADGEVAVRLDPGMAFGTGLHPTTQLCLRLLERHARPGQRVLDLGTGSGILAIAAAKLGAAPVLALDNDPVAVEVAAENVARNGVPHLVRAAVGSLGAGNAMGHWLSGDFGEQGTGHRAQATGEAGAGEPASFDLIAANLIAKVLVILAEDLAAALAPGGVLVSSGIIDTKEAEVSAALAAAGLRQLERHVEGEWVALVHCRL